SLFTICEQKSKPFPKILTDKKILNLVKSGLPEGISINEFDDEGISNPNLVFMGEMEFNGLFGYETISTRLIKKFGQEFMLSAYAKRQGNLPAPGQYSESLTEAKKFTDNFEIQGIEIIANSEGIMDFTIGHPSETISSTKILESNSIKDVGQHKTMVISTGKDASNDNLANSFSSLWNCSNAIKKDGLAILIAECKGGLGSDALQQYLEGRLTLEQLRNPSKYISGMENLLFLSEIQKNFQIGLVSILPEFYAKKLNMISMQGIKYSMDYILKTQGTRQKIAVVTDGARLLLR
ncbi:MAG: transcriptional regulator, partial [Nitrosopumilus sp.]|nr:transcriptional regulator [Nitrosopumilus sp.]